MNQLTFFFASKVWSKSVLCLFSEIIRSLWKPMSQIRFLKSSFQLSDSPVLIFDQELGLVLDQLRVEDDFFFHESIDFAIGVDHGEVASGDAVDIIRRLLHQQKDQSKAKAGQQANEGREAVVESKCLARVIRTYLKQNLRILQNDLNNITLT